ncbi:MAG: serine hydrolase domain-containing protein [Hyphomicrobiaceae bacterium]
MTGRKAIDALLARAVESGSVPGVVALAHRGGTTIYEGAFGTRQLGSGIAVTPDTVHWIASMTKAITAACVMQLVEAGRIGLDDDVGRIVPALARPQVLEGFDAEGRPRLRPARGAITLRRLLTHTAGFVYDTWNADMLRYMEATGISRAASFVRPEDCQPLAFDPGTRWEYGINIDWAGKVLEALTGETLDGYMQGHLLAPLGMSSTGYLLRPEIRARLAGMHQRAPDGRLSPVPYDPPQSPDHFLGGGGLYSTVGDYMRFMRMILGGGALEGVRVLRPETVALMSSNHIGDIDVAPMRSTRPEMSADADFFPGQRVKWGLSFLINTEDVPGRRRAGSLAWAGLRNTYYWIDPATRTAGTIMTQILPFADPAVLALFEAFEREVYATAA